MGFKFIAMAVIIIRVNNMGSPIGVSRTRRFAIREV
jgi:hypothetical protein